jgi:hypothetical protein
MIKAPICRTSMTPSAWHPTDEQEAASTLAVFVEWLRAGGQMPDASPARVAAWRLAEPAAFRHAIAGFAGMNRAGRPRDNLLLATGPRAALVLHRGGVRRQWSRDEWRQRQPALPADIDAMLENLTWPVLLDVAARHLLDAGTRPDDRLLWTGDAADPLPYGALVAGATLVVAEAQRDGGAALATAEGAVIFRPPLSGPDGR